MSTSSHLTPEPERRLWLILESVRRAVDKTDLKIGMLTAFAAGELALLRPGLLSALPLAAALPLGVFAFLPFSGKPKGLAYLDPRAAKPGLGDCLIAADDVAKYALGDLIQKMDKYLGGGITATQYYEDIVGQILVCSRVAAKKNRLFQAACALVALGQLGLLGRILLPS